MVGNRTDRHAATEDLETGEPMRAIVADDDPFARQDDQGRPAAGRHRRGRRGPDGREAVELPLHYRPTSVAHGRGDARARRDLPPRGASSKEIPTSSSIMLDELRRGRHGSRSGLRAGAVGLSSPRTSTSTCCRRRCDGASGEAAISRRLGMRLVEQLRRTPEGATGLRPVKSPLTAREWEVIDLLYEGRTTDQIADPLVLSTETVRSHVEEHPAQARRPARATRRSRLAQPVRGRRAAGLDPTARQAGSVKWNGCRRPVPAARRSGRRGARRCAADREAEAGAVRARRSRRPR